MKYIAFNRDGKAEFAALDESIYEVNFAALPNPKIELTEAEFNALGDLRFYKINEQNQLVVDTTAQSEKQIAENNLVARFALKESDWAALPDVNLANQQEWLDYRATLRQIVSASGVLPSGLTAVPEKPQTIWA